MYGSFAGGQSINWHATYIHRRITGSLAFALVIARAVEAPYSIMPGGSNVDWR